MKGDPIKKSSNRKRKAQREPFKRRTKNRAVADYPSQYFKTAVAKWGEGPPDARRFVKKRTRGELRTAQLCEKKNENIRKKKDP